MSRHQNDIRLVSPTTTVHLPNIEKQVLSSSNGVNTITVDHLAQPSTTLSENYFDYGDTAPSVMLPQGPRTRMPNPSNFSENNLYSPYSMSPPHNVLLPRSCSISRRSRHFVPNEHKDEYYWQKRRKNNEAARKSREKRKTIDNVLEEKVLILSHENEVLRQELYLLKVKYGEIEPDSNRQCQAKKTFKKGPPLLIDAERSLAPFLFENSNDSNQELLVNQKLGLSRTPHLKHPASTELSPRYSVNSPESGSSQITPPVELPFQDLQHPLDLIISKNHKVRDSRRVSINNNNESNSLQDCHKEINETCDMAGINSDNFGISFLSKIARGQFYLSPVDLSQKCSKQTITTSENGDVNANVNAKKVSSPVYEAANALVILGEGHSSPKEESSVHPLTLKLSYGSRDSITSLPHKLRFKQSKSL